MAFKDMPYDEKYNIVSGYLKLLKEFSLQLVQEDLGKGAVDELRGIWREESWPIPERAPLKAKYETAFCNWMRNWTSAYGFINRHMGKRGSDKFKHRYAEALMRRTSGVTLFMLKMLRVLSPRVAFRAFTKQAIYQLQIFGPCNVLGMDGYKAIIHMTYDALANGKEDPYFILGYQKVYHLWIHRQFNVMMTTERHPKGGCIITLSAL